MPKSRHTHKHSSELSTAEKRAELEVEISKVDYALEKTDQAFATIIAFVFFIVSRGLLDRYFNSPGLNFIDTNLRRLLTTDSFHPGSSLVVFGSVISLVNCYLGPLLYAEVKDISRRAISTLNSRNNDKIKNARKIVENPLTELSVINDAIKELSLQGDFLNRMEYLTFFTPLIVLLMQMFLFLAVLSELYFDFEYTTTYGRELIVEFLFVATINLPIWIEMYTNSKIRRKQRSLQSSNYALLTALTQDLEGLTLKRTSPNDLGYTALLFKIADFKITQTLRYNGKNYNLSYKDVFEGMLYCINQIKTMNITRMDKHCIIISVGLNNRNWTSQTSRATTDCDALKQELIVFFEHKHTIAFLEEKLLRNLREATHSLNCDWQAVEKKENGLPKILFIADVAHLDEKMCNDLLQGLFVIYKNRMKLENNEIIIEPTRDDIHAGYLDCYRNLKNLIEGKTALKSSQKKSSAILPSLNLYSPGIAGNIIPSKPVQPFIPSPIPVSAKIEDVRSFSIKWSNGITYVHDTEQAKSLDDDTRIIPLTSGRNNVVLYKRFLIIDPKLKDVINNKELYKRYVGCFWKSIAPKSNEQGRKRVITDYRDCNGKQQISEWEVKIPRTDPRAYVRILDVKSDPPGVVLCIADGFHPHPHQR